MSADILVFRVEADWERFSNGVKLESQWTDAKEVETQKHWGEDDLWLSVSDCDDLWQFVIFTDFDDLL